MAEGARRMTGPAPKTAAPVFSALGDATRLELVARLGDREPHSITQLCDGLELTRQGVSKHLRVLQGAGIVRSDRVGREQQFRIVPKPIDEARAYLETVSRQWDEALGRLRAFVEPQ